jgi:hypothetical protein
MIKETNMDQSDFQLLWGFFQEHMRKFTDSELMGYGDAENTTFRIADSENGQWIYSSQAGILEHHDCDGNFAIFEIKRVA